MFYLKTKLANGKVVKTDITDENLFTRCPDCGRELPVDLVEVFSDGEGDLFSTSIICSTCTKKRAEKLRLNDSIKITVDGIALLSDMLCQAGYSEQMYGLFDEYEIEAVQELAPEQYKPFADALKALATEDGGL
jgi:hypothetical protein